MPKQRIPLVGSMMTRNVDASTLLTSKDQIFKNVIFDIIKNPATGKASIFVGKRPGIKTGSEVVSTKMGFGICEQFGFNTFTSYCTVWSSGGSTNENIYVGSTSVGDTDGVGASHSSHITKAYIAGEEAYLIQNDRACYFIVGSAMSGNTTFTGDTTSGNADILNASSTTGLYIGQKLSGTGIQSGARISAISGSTVTMTLTASATNTGVTITRERMSKFIDADFPSSTIGPMWEMDGYIFVAEKNSQKIYHSDLNSLTSWTSTNFISANATPGRLLGIARLGQMIVAITTDSLQFFYNAGNAVGSVLSRIQNRTHHIGNQDVGGGIFSGTKQYAPFDVLDDYLYVVCDKVLRVSQDGSVKVISTQIIDRLIDQTALNSINIQAFHLYGTPYVYLASSDVIYDCNLNLWSHVEFTDRAGAAFKPRISKHQGYAQETVLVASGGSGYVHTMSNSTPVYQDCSTTITTMIQMQRLDFGTAKRKHVTRMDLIGDKQASGTVTVTQSDDDFATFASLGTFDLTSMTPKIHRCGHFTGGRSIKMVHTANANFRAEALDVYYEENEEST